MVNLIKDTGQEFLREVLIIVDSSIVSDEVRLGHTDLDLRVVSIGVEHDRRIREHVSSIYSRVGMSDPVNKNPGQTNLHS